MNEQMLKLAKDFDETTRVHMYLGERVAQNADGTMFLKRSNGHRRTGRPTNYWLRRPEAMAIKIHAYTDAEAVEKANFILFPKQSEINAIQRIARGEPA